MAKIVVNFEEDSYSDYTFLIGNKKSDSNGNHYANQSKVRVDLPDVVTVQSAGFYLRGLTVNALIEYFNSSGNRVHVAVVGPYPLGWKYHVHEVLNVKYITFETSASMDNCTIEFDFQADPVADFVVNDGATGLEKQFVSTSVDALGGTEYLTKYEWDFTGNGEFVEATPTYTYTYDHPGVYRVTLRVSQGDQTATTQQLVWVSTPGIALISSLIDAVFSGECISHYLSAQGGNPIGLADGEKTERVTDLSVNTPAGSLDFTRVFRQSKFDTLSDVGFGWTHNHIATLNTDVTDEITVQIPGGGFVPFTRVGTSDVFEGVAGSASVIDASGSGLTAYVLIAEDKTVWEFDGSKRLRKRIRPNGETWTYSYYTSGAAVNLLESVSDDYGRGLQFTYIDNSGQYNHNMLRRVGDHNATGLDGGSPSGRYVEYSYVEEKLAGSVITPDTKALLSSVQDVLGNTWTYEYYGQQASETDGDLGNYLLRVSSPTVDTDGDGTADATITINDQTYTVDNDVITQIVQKRGQVGSGGFLEETTFTFGESITTETRGDKTVNHEFLNGVYLGARNALGYANHQLQDEDYRPIEQYDANDNSTYMEWNDGKTLASVQDASNNKTEFAYDALDRLTISTDAMSRKTSYVYEKDQRQPTMIVTGCDVDEIDLFSTPNEADDWDGVSSPTTNQRVPFADSGEAMRYVNAANSGEGIESIQWNLTNNESYELSARIFIVSGAVKMQIPGAGTATSVSTDSWETLTISYSPYSGSTLADRTLQLVADGGAAEFYVDNISIVHQSSEILADGGMETIWREVGSLTTNELSTTQVDVGEQSRYVVTDAADEGIATAEFDAFPGFSYQVTARVYVSSGTIRLEAPDDPTQDQTSTQTGAWETLTYTWTPQTTLLNTSIPLVSDGGAASFYVDEVSILRDGSEQIVDGGMESNWTDVNGATHIRVVGAEAGDYARWITTSAADQGIENDDPFDLQTGHTYLTIARVYVVSGNVKMLINGVSNLETTTVRTGKWQTLRLVTTNPSATDATVQFLADGGAAEFYVDQVHLVDLSNYDDLAQVTWQEYISDRQGHVVFEAILEAVTAEVIQASERTYYTDNGLLESMTRIDPQDASNNTSITYTYDSVGRVIKTHRSSLLGTCQFSYTVYDKAGNVEATVCGLQNTTPPVDKAAAESMYDAGDSVKKYNNVTIYSYDSLGRRVTTTTHPGNSAQKETTLVIYDALGRVTMQIANYENPLVGDPATPTYEAPGNWTFDDTNGVWRDGDQVTDTIIGHGTDLNENIISRTEYNERGLVRLTQDHLGHVTLYGYDDADRLVKTVQNATTPEYNNNYSGISPDPDLSDYTEITTSNDIDIITEQFYDAVGNLVKTIDPAGRVTYTVYDVLNRPIKVVANAKDLATIDINDVNYALENDPRSTSYVISTDLDRDQITVTEYDVLGRVTRAKRLINVVDSVESWDTTLYGYDALGRQVKTIAHASDDTYIVYDYPDLSDYDPSPDPDVDIITEIFYNAEGQVSYTKDSLGRETHYAYDGLQRETLTVGNFNDNSYQAVDNWIWDDVTDNRWEDGANTAIGFGADNDENIIANTGYNGSGYVQFTRDVDGRIRYFVYDGLGRQIRTIQNYVSNGEDPSLWVWDGTTDNRWEESDGTAIDHGTGFDQNIVTETIYGVQGRVESTRDVQGNVTRFVYDSANRRIRTIQNYVAQGATDPKDWVWATDQWEDGATNAIDHTSNPNNNQDQNQISDTIYDLAGRVEETMDTRGNVTHYIYDDLGRRIRTIQNYEVIGSSDPKDWVWVTDQWEDGASSAIHTTDFDENIISDTTYSKDGRVINTRSHNGNETYFVYDDAGRRIRTVQNYTGTEDPALWVWDETASLWKKSDGNAVNHADFDENLITETLYNKSGQVIQTRDPRGTETQFVYDLAGRRVCVVQAANTAVATTSYTCFDKAGRVLRTIANWQDDGTDPDEQDGNGDWVFNPTTHGTNNDLNLITEYEYDGVNRRVKIINPNGDDTQTSYFKDGTVDTVTVAITDLEDVVTAYRYDNLRRRTRVVQSYVDNTEDPAEWKWTDPDWTKNDGITVIHPKTGGVVDDPDQNVIVDVIYDTLGRIIQLRDPRGNETSYSYDNLGRRIEHTIDPNGLNMTWLTSYENVGNVTQTKMKYPGITGSGTYDVVREFDRLGRLTEIDYDDLTNTPTVQFAYDKDGNRQKMTEIDSSTIRETAYGYDALGRLTSVGFDNDGDSTVDETVEYEYDIVGNRTKLTLPGDDDIIYAYDRKGRLISITDWDGQVSTFQYDKAGRHISTQRNNGFYSQYRYSPVGHLQELRHGTEWDIVKALDSYIYTTDKLGNRTQAQEIGLRDTGGSPVTIAHDDATVVYRGLWQVNGNFHESDGNGAKLLTVFYGDTDIDLTMGTGPDCGIYDVYINKTLWRSFDGYATSESEEVISLDVNGQGPHLLEIYQTRDKNAASSGYKVRFKQLDALDAFETTTIDYTYDNLSRLLEADYDSGSTVYTYGYDLAGNLVNNNGTTRTFNAANQMTNDGTNTLTYDNNGNLTSDGTNTHTWDRANRLLSVGTHSYAYDGNGARIQKTVSSIVTDYLLDVQPGLTQVLRESDGTNANHYIHSPRGIHAMNDGSNWSYMLQDGLGSVRAEIGANVSVNGSQNYAPYGEVFGASGSFASPYGFTGEQTDGNGQVYLRARYYNPSIGVFNALDPFEGSVGRPMSLNGYSWVEGNPVMNVDPSGRCIDARVCRYLKMSGIPIGDCPVIPEINSSCPAYTQNGINILASTAVTETDNFGVLTQSNEAAVALMLFQLNYYSALNDWKLLGTWKNKGVAQEELRISNPPVVGDGGSKYNINVSGQRTRVNQLLTIAEYAIAGHCSGDALKYFRDGLTCSGISEIVGKLDAIANNPLAKSEVSIRASRAQQFREDKNSRGEPTYPIQYVVDIPGSERAIVVGDSNVESAWIGYQCNIGEQAVLRDSPDVLPRPLTDYDIINGEIKYRYECKPCTSVSEWYIGGIPFTTSEDEEEKQRIQNQRAEIEEVLGRGLTGARYEAVTDAERDLVRSKFRGLDYVKSCS